MANNIDSTEKLLRKIPTTRRDSNNKSWGRERICFPELPRYNSQNVRFSPKNYRACKEKRKYGSCTGENNVITLYG